MPCSCKAKKQVSYVDPQKKTVEQVNIAQVNIEQVQSSSTSQFILQGADTYLSIKSSLDTSSTTKPDQFCLNCTRKHLGLAQILSQKNSSLNNFIAVGQIMCASLHLRGTFINYSMLLQDLALSFLRQLKFQPYRPLLISVINQLSGQVTLDRQEYIPLPPFKDQQQLLNLALVYSLLFVQLTYQQINKTWATAYLNYFCYNSFRLTTSLQKIQLYRPLWKLIQSMQPMDDNYIAARKYIQSLITKLYINEYRPSLGLQQKKQLIVQQFKDRSQLLKTLRVQINSRKNTLNQLQLWLKQKPLPQPS